MALTKVTMTGTVDTIKAGFDKVNDIIDDLAAATSGLGASCVGVYDADGNLAATDVEAAIAEIYTDMTGTMALAEVFNENPDTTTGLTWGYKAGTIRVDNTITTVNAGTVGLTDDDVNYVEINSSGTVSKNLTGFTSGSIPLRQITTASGAQTVSTDKRAWYQVWVELKDEDDMASDSNEVAASQQSIKAYVDGLVTTIQSNLYAPATTDIIGFAQNAAPTLWTRKTDRQDTAMICLAASGNIAAAGSTNPQSAHAHGAGSIAVSLIKAAPLAASLKGAAVGTFAAEAGFITYGGGGAQNFYQASNYNNPALNSGSTDNNTAPYTQEVIECTKD